MRVEPYLLDKNIATSLEDLKYFFPKSSILKNFIGRKTSLGIIILHKDRMANQSIMLININKGYIEMDALVNKEIENKARKILKSILLVFGEHHLN